MKKRRIVTSLLLVLVLAIGSLGVVGCTPKKGQDDEPPNPTKTQLNIGNYDAGYGTDWLRALKPMFEEEYKDVCFEPGVYVDGVEKKGVQLMIDADKISYAGDGLRSIVSSSPNHIFFSDAIYYREWVKEGKFLDVTDMVNSSMEDVGEEGTMLDKFQDFFKDFYLVDGKYYGVPHYEGQTVLTYNIDLFESNLLYFADDKNNGNEGFIKSLSDKRGTGPDGKYNTSDDGLPRTYDEFYKMCARMKRMNISPLTVAGGKYPAYVTFLLSALWADYEGAEQMALNYNFDGTAKTIVESIGAGGNITFKGGNEGVKITAENGYELSQQAGRYYALDFLHNMLKNNNFAKNAFNNTTTHLSIQADFLYTGIVPAVEKIGMLSEGIYWIEEAKGTFKEMSNSYKNADLKSRRIAVMPLPRATEEKVGTKYTLLDPSVSLAFINANISENMKPLAKLFLKWCATNRALQQYTLTTNSTRNYKYDLTEEQYNSMCTFGQSAWDYRKNADVVYSISNSAIYSSNSTAFFPTNIFWSKTSSGSFAHPSTAMKDYNVTSTQYFAGIKEYYSKGYWDSNYSRYY